MKSSSIIKSHPEVSMATIGLNFSALRKAKGFTRATVAYNAHMSLATLYRLESGKCHSVGFLKLVDLCNYYGVKPAEIVTEGYFSVPDNLPANK